MRALAIAILGTFFVACGGGGSSGPVTLDSTQKQQVQENSTNTVEAGVALNALKTDAQADEPISKLSQIFGYASQLWSTKMSAEGAAAYGLATDVFQGALTDGCVTESGGTITYNCNDYGYSITGTVTVSGDTVAIDLAYAGSGTSFTYKGSVTVTDTSIDGNIDFTYDTTQGTTMTYEITIDYATVMLNAEGCPISGSLNIDVNITNLPAEYAAYSSAYNFPAVEIKFGPACGDVVMY